MKTRLVYLALSLLSAAAVLAAPAASAETVSTASLLYPSQGTVATDARVQFTWTPVAGAESYYLYVGSVPGARDVVDSRETLQTTFTAANLVANSTLYVRLWTKTGGHWAYVDSTFTIAPLTATLTTPAAGAVDVSIAPTLQWNSLPSAQAYVVWIGSAAGASDILKTPETVATSYTPSRLPANQQLFARMWTKIGGVWRYADSQFATAATAVLIAPANGAMDVALNQPAVWTAVPAAQAYYLYVGTTPGTHDIVNTGEIQQTSYSRGLWPAGRLLYARLWTKAGDQWRFQDTSFATQPAASLSSPAPGSTNVPPTQIFSWQPIDQAQAYTLYVGTASGARDIADSGEIATASYQPRTSLPTGRTLYARLWTKWGDAWRSVDSTFSTSPVAILMTPSDGAKNALPNQVFSWTPIPGADAYVLYVGTTPGASDIFRTAETPQVSFQAVALPPNRTLYARLWTKAGGVWRYVDSSFTVVVVAATITSPPTGATNVSSADPFTWTTVPNADAYVLWVGTTQGAHDVFATPEIEETSYYPMSLPAKQALFARIWASVGGTWRYTDTSFTSAPLTAELLNPPDGASSVDSSQPALWTKVPGAQAHVLYVGSAPGGSDLLRSPESPDTSYPLSSLPPGHVYARLWTQVGGVWRFVDSSFTIGSRRPQFVQPVDGSLAVDSSQPFLWAASLHAQAYRLTIGTAPGARDVVDSGELAGTSYVPTVALPSGPLYARVIAKIGGVWALRSDVRFTTDTTAATAVISSPENRTLTFDTANPFTWNPVPFANAYRLTIGTARGLTDLHDSGTIHVTRRFVPDLPVGVLLYGRLQTQIGEHWYSRRFTFTVAANTVSIDTRLDNVLWETDVVRRMSELDNQPYTWTPLARHVRASRDYAVCSDFAEVLADMLNEMNLGLPATRRDIAFNTNGYDGHSIVNVFDPRTSRWLAVDPTFDLIVRRADGAWATPEEISQSVAGFDWTAVSYQFLGYEDDPITKHYYLDYPLLYLNVTQPLLLAQGASPLPYLTEVPLPASGSPGFYIVGCLEPGAVNVVVDGTLRTLACNGIDSLTLVFGAGSVAAPDGATAAAFRLYRPNRYVF